jgi:hypothetical protein
MSAAERLTEPTREQSEGVAVETEAAETNPAPCGSAGSVLDERGRRIDVLRLSWVRPEPNWFLVAPAEMLPVSDRAHRAAPAFHRAPRDLLADFVAIAEDSRTGLNGTILSGLGPGGREAARGFLTAATRFCGTSV